MFTLMQNMQQSISKLLAQQDELSKSSKTTESNLLQMCTGLKTENTALRDQVTTLSANSSGAFWQQLPRAHGTLVLGSSIVRDIDENKLVGTKCVSISGGKISDAQNYLDSLPRQEMFERIVLVIGGNDCDVDQELDIKALTDQYRDVINAAKAHSNKVTVSSICPRDKSPEASVNIASMNRDLITLCSETNIDFVDSTAGFWVSDGSLNDGYILDGVHLKTAGTNHLVTKLGLKLKSGLKSACTFSRRQPPKGVAESRGVTGDSHAVQEADELSHQFWDRSWQKVQPRGRHAPNHQKRPAPPRQQHRPTRPVQHTHLSQPAYQHSSPPPPTRNIPHQQHTASRSQQTFQRPSNNVRIQAAPKPIPLMQLNVATPSRAQTHIPQLITSPLHPLQHDTRSHRNPAHFPDSIQCQLCSGRGHAALTCRSRDATCYKCGNVGHYARTCPNAGYK